MMTSNEEDKEQAAIRQQYIDNLPVVPSKPPFYFACSFVPTPSSTCPNLPAHVHVDKSWSTPVLPNQPAADKEPYHFRIQYELDNLRQLKPQARDLGIIQEGCRPFVAKGPNCQAP